jgi:hypothetical protein
MEDRFGTVETVIIFSYHAKSPLSFIQRALFLVFVQNYKYTEDYYQGSLGIPSDETWVRCI